MENLAVKIKVIMQEWWIEAIVSDNASDIKHLEFPGHNLNLIVNEAHIESYIYTLIENVKLIVRYFEKVEKLANY